MFEIRLRKIAVRRVAWGAAIAGLLLFAYRRFFDGTSFSLDDFVWLWFARFYPNPIDILWRDTLCGQFFRPVGQFWWLAVHSLAGESLRLYQVAFLGAHLVNAALASQLAREIVSPRGPGRPPGPTAGVRPMLFLLFALNPIFLAPVSFHYCYIFDVLGFLFYLAALLCFRRAVKMHSRLAGALSLWAAVLSYFSKEAFFTLPVALALIAGIRSPGERWRFGVVRERFFPWMVLHLAVWIAAVAWRTAVLGRLGGYGLVSITDVPGFFEHVVNRISALVGFAGWSLVPALERWTGSEFLPLLGSAVLLGLLTWIHVRTGERPGAAWIWAWMVLTWAPSALMTTYAAVSWYACLFGSLLLLAVPLSRLRTGVALTLLIGGYYAYHGAAGYAERLAHVAEVREQQRALRQAFPEGGRERPSGERVFLFRSSPDLLPDPIVKYGTPPGRPMADVLFLNDRAPVNWVVTNRDGPGEIRPMYVDQSYQGRFMDLHRYRAYPLAFENRRIEILRRGDPFRFFVWQEGRLVNVTDQNPLGEAQPRLEH